MGFDYKGFAGGSRDLAGLESSVYTPNRSLSARASFLAFGCRGGDELNEMGGFGFSWAMRVASHGGDSGVGDVRECSTRWPVCVPDGPQGRLWWMLQIRRRECRLCMCIAMGVVRRFCVLHARRCRGWAKLALSSDGRKRAVLHDGAIEVFYLACADGEGRRRRYARHLRLQRKGN